MKGPLFKLWDHIRSSFWFTPTVMAGVAMGLAVVSVTLDDAATEWLSRKLGWSFSGGAEGASAVLEIIAGSMITIAGVVFSMTLVALSLASSQLGPRLLRSFMRDATTQVVLGTFISTFLYCLIVARTVRHTGEQTFVPHLSVTLGVLLAIVSVGVFIYFIHHVSVSIQANEIAARIGKELIEGIELLFPSRRHSLVSNRNFDRPGADFLAAFARESVPLNANRDGYLQFTDSEALFETARNENLLVRLERLPGSYVVAGCPLAMISPANRISHDLTDRLHTHFVLGHQRTEDQDVEFSVNQLVEIAVRALSPGLNDPFTAITCVDHLASALCRLASRDIPSPYRYDDAHQLRLIAPAVSFAELVDSAFSQIRQYSRSSLVVTIRLLDAIALIASFVGSSEDCATLLRHADMIARDASLALPEEQDRKAVGQHHEVVRQICKAAG